MARPKKIHAPAKDKLDEIGIDSICERIAEGSTLRDIAALADVGIGSVMRYCEKPEHVEQYARAMAIRHDVMAESMLDIADEECTMVRSTKHPNAKADDDGNLEVVFDSAAVARNRLRVDARKWYLSKLAPKKYGDRVAIGGDPENPVVINNNVAVTDWKTLKSKVASKAK
jgi:hypothetical protein